ncbi:MAG: DUF86 domain-containing protein [Chloroflexota bacterium]
MAFDIEIVQARIAIIEENLTKLEQIPQANFDEFIADFRNVESTKHLLQTAIEAMVDICSHCAARLRLHTPENGTKLVHALAKANLIPSEHVPIYAQMIRFRNLVVHLYTEVDDQQIYDILQHHLNDFRLFIADTWRIMHGKTE